MSRQPPQRSDFVLAHEPRVARHVSREDGDELAFDGLGGFGHGSWFARIPSGDQGSALGARGSTAAQPRWQRNSGAKRHISCGLARHPQAQLCPVPSRTNVRRPSYHHLRVATCIGFCRSGRGSSGPARTCERRRGLLERVQACSLSRSSNLRRSQSTVHEHGQDHESHGECSRLIRWDEICPGDRADEAVDLPPVLETHPTLSPRPRR